KSNGKQKHGTGNKPILGGAVTASSRAHQVSRDYGLLGTDQEGRGLISRISCNQGRLCLVCFLFCQRRHLISAESEPGAVCMKSRPVDIWNGVSNLAGASAPKLVSRILTQSLDTERVTHKRAAGGYQSLSHPLTPSRWWRVSECCKPESRLYKSVSDTSGDMDVTPNLLSCVFLSVPATPGACRVVKSETKNFLWLGRLSLIFVLFYNLPFGHKTH
ncbi:hypothetical protein BaRGS_00021172, partial [Batillaria attramentaria]